MGGWWQDLRHAGRMIGRQPGPSALAVVALALGIGLTTTMFSIVQGAILRGLPFEESEKIQYLSVVTPSNPDRGQSPSYHDFVDWRTQQHSFESLEGYNQSTMIVTGPGGYPERIRGARLTPGVLRALRVTPALGRGFTDQDAAPGSPAVIIIGHTVWESRFRSQPDAIGQTLSVNGVPTTVIGVMPPKFAFPQTQNAWQPLSFTLAPKRGAGGSLNVIGRLTDGVTERQAATEMEGIVGLGLAWTGAALFSRAIVDTDPPFWIDVRLDPVVLVFVTAITVTAALVSSLVPGWRLARTDVNDALKDEGRGSTSLRMGRFTRWLVVVEVTVSCVLLVVSGLMIRNIVATSRFDYPFATEDVFHGRISLDSRAFPESADVARANVLVEERLSRLPGLRAVALATSIPRAEGGGSRLEVEGRTYESSEATPQVRSITASTAYFDVLRVQPLLGRLFGVQDVADGLPVVIVDQGFARRHLPEGPIGRRIRFGRRVEGVMKFDDSPWLTVVGVVPVLAESAVPTQNADTVFRPLTQSSSRSLMVLASTQGAPMAIAPSVRLAMAEIGEGTPVTNMNALDDELWQQGWAVRVFGTLFMAFGVAALVLASAGLYGVMAFGVKQRTQEIGVRMAMGADRRTVLRMVLWQGTWRVAIAIVVGLIPGWWLGTQMSALINDVSPSDSLVHSVTAVTLLLSGVLATLAPALRAASVDPIHALRGTG